MGPVIYRRCFGAAVGKFKTYSLAFEHVSELRAQSALHELPSFQNCYVEELATLGWHWHIRDSESVSALRGLHQSFILINYFKSQISEFLL